MKTIQYSNLLFRLFIKIKTVVFNQNNCLIQNLCYKKTIGKLKKNAVTKLNFQPTASPYIFLITIY